MKPSSRKGQPGGNRGGGADSRNDPREIIDHAASVGRARRHEGCRRRARWRPCRGSVAVRSWCAARRCPRWRRGCPTRHGHARSRSTASARCARASWRWRRRSGCGHFTTLVVRMERRARAPASSRATSPPPSRCKIIRSPRSSTATCAIPRSTRRSERAPTTAGSSTFSSSPHAALDQISASDARSSGLHLIPAGHPPVARRASHFSSPGDAHADVGAARRGPCYVVSSTARRPRVRPTRAHPLGRSAGFRRAWSLGYGSGCDGRRSRRDRSDLRRLSKFAGVVFNERTLMRPCLDAQSSISDVD